MIRESTTAAEPSRLDLVERRRIVFEQLLWQVPSISFAGQAFLLSVVLRPDTPAFGRLVASTFGLVTAIAVLQTFVKHRYTEELSPSG